MRTQSRLTRRLIRRIAVAMPAVLAAAVLSVTSPGTAAADTLPAPLPDQSSTPAQKQQMSPRPEDQATHDALHGDQTGGGAGPDGAGTSHATPLAPSASWQVAPQTGDFSWSYPLRVPPSPGGLDPDLALGYSSSSVDGHTSATNNQASWVGDGWDLSVGYVERAYTSCQDDTMDGTTPPKNVGDLCWRSDNATATYAGGGGPLIHGANDDWRVQDDDGSRVEHLFGAANGDDNGEYWKITTVDGTQYFFGSRPESHSTWNVPVFGDDANEPCHQATFEASHCVQAWRWNLDKVVDRNGNQILYGYDAETNSYGMDLKDTAVPYTRGGTLRTIEYGMRDGEQPTGKVLFDVADRCVPGSDCTPAKPDNWPDVPWDQNCATATCGTRYAPSFWSTKRLAKITAQVRGDSGFTDVDSWTLDQQYPIPGDGEKASLWLHAVTHTGLGGGSITLPSVTFEGSQLPNRVYVVGDGLAPLIRYRVTGIVSESGGWLSVKYTDSDCVGGGAMPANPETNTMRCFPQRWNKKDYSERTDYFFKYPVAEVTQSDAIGANPTQITDYQYLGGAAWHYDTSETAPESKKTWNEFRGFGQVIIRTGSPNDDAGPIGKTELRFYRGMNGDKLPSGTRTGVTVPPTDGPARPDDDWLRGQQLESITYNGDTDQVVTKIINDPAAQGPTAIRNTTGGTWPAAYKAYQIRTGASQSYQALAAGGFRSTRAEYGYDDRGLLIRTDDLGDTSTTNDDKCTRVTFVRNPDKWLLNLPARAETVGVSCSAAPSFPADAVTDVRTAYDGQDFGAAPTSGNATRSQEASQRPASGPVYVTTGTRSYDVYGRVVRSTDALGNASTVDYTPATGGPATRTVAKNPLGQAVTTTLDPAWGQAVAVVDANNRKTETAYDALGRTTSIWLANRPRGTYADSPSSTYTYLIRKDGPSVVTSSRLGPKENYLTSKEIYDGLLRLRQKQEPAQSGGRLITDTRYDSQGRVWKATQPFYNDGAVDDNLWVAADSDTHGLTRYVYDGAGRNVAEVYQNGAGERWRTTTAYRGDRVTVTPPSGGTATTTISNPRGQTVELRQYHGGTPTGAYDTTTYTWTDAGKLASVTDPAGNAWTYTYDLRGNRIVATDPDRGTTTMGYDAANQMKSSTDARGTTLTYTYDPLGRKTAEKLGDTTTLASWGYDTATNGKGQLASSTRYVDGNAYTTAVAGYSSLYQPLQTAVTIPASEGALAGTYATYQKYKVDGSPAGKGMPAAGDLAGETVSWSYDDLGHPDTVTGGLNGSGTTDDLVTHTDYTRYGERARVELGDSGKRFWQTWYYETDTRRMNRTTVDAEVTHPSLADLNYTYDDAGDVTSIADTPQAQVADTQCFRYDYLQRLTEAWTPGNGCSADPSTAALAGPAPYWQSFQYDTVGNRTSDTTHAAGGDTTRGYTSTGHLLASVTTGGGTSASTDQYSYDPAGDTTARPGQTLSWDAEGRLASVTAAGPTSPAVTSYVYDADGNRLIRHDPTGATLYLDGQELRLDAGTGKLTGTRYYQLGDQTVAMRTAAGLTWLASDQQGTAEIAVDSATQRVVERRQTPYGTGRGAAVTFPGEKGFVGGTADASTGLTHLGAREYDPGLGRFVSADPVQDLTDPQQMNGYAYSDDNPVTHADPTGALWGWLKSAASAVGNAFVAAAKDATEHPLEFVLTTVVGVAVGAAGAAACAVTVGIACAVIGSVVGGMAAGMLSTSMQAAREGRSATLGEMATGAEVGGIANVVLEGAGRAAAGKIAGKAGEELDGRLLPRDARAAAPSRPRLDAGGQARALDAAASARDAEMDRYVGKTFKETPATFTAGINPYTGEVSVGWSDGAGNCAECMVADKLGIPMNEVLYTYAYGYRSSFTNGKGLRMGPKGVIGERDRTEVPICKRCQQSTSPSQYPPDVLHEPGGAWDGGGDHYTKPDGSFCNRHGGPCAI